MPDITMCKDNNCLYKEGCYRYMAEPNKFRQSYFSESPREEDGSCNYYVDIATQNINSDELL